MFLFLIMCPIFAFPPAYMRGLRTCAVRKAAQRYCFFSIYASFYGTNHKNNTKMQSLLNKTHVCEKNKYLPLKMQINSIFTVKSLCILRIWNIVISTATLRGDPSKFRPHFCANNKQFPLKMQINSIFIVKSLCIPNICSNFAADFKTS